MPTIVGSAGASGREFAGSSFHRAFELLAGFGHLERRVMEFDRGQIRLSPEDQAGTGQLTRRRLVQGLPP
jgi:hypothetical protein